MFLNNCDVGYKSLEKYSGWKRSFSQEVISGEKQRGLSLGLGGGGSDCRHVTYAVEMKANIHWMEYMLLVTKMTIHFTSTAAYHGATALSDPGPSHNLGFTITLRHTKFGRNPLDE